FGIAAGPSWTQLLAPGVGATGSTASSAAVRCAMRRVCSIACRRSCAVRVVVLGCRGCSLVLRVRARRLVVSLARSSGGTVRSMLSSSWRRRALSVGGTADRSFCRDRVVAGSFFCARCLRMATPLGSVFTLVTLLGSRVAQLPERLLSFLRFGTGVEVMLFLVATERIVRPWRGPGRYSIGGLLAFFRHREQLCLVPQSDRAIS